MSTRCQVQVIQEGIPNWTEKISLYHHSDGYPEHIISDIYEAYQRFKIRGWEIGRAGKVASFLCAVCPGSFQPEMSHNIHPDIEFYYKLYVVNRKQGSIGDIPTWEVEIYTLLDEGLRLIRNRENIFVVMTRIKKPIITKVLRRINYDGCKL